MKYPGGKGGAGVFHSILREIPPHEVYIEPFAGGANVFERKARARRSVLCDLDVRTVDRLRSSIVGSDVEVRCGNAFDLLSGWQWQGNEFVYLDPPYLHSTRRSLDLYRFEMSDADHVRLLDLVASLPVTWALSGYRSALYDDASSVHGWRRVDFPAMSRGGLRVESLWCNYAAPASIADPAYAGRDFRDRQRIKRKAARWVERFEALPSLERQAILERLRTAGIFGDGDVGSSIVSTDESAVSSAMALRTEES